MSEGYSREEKPYAEARIKKSHGIYGTMNEKPQVAGVQNIRDKWKKTTIQEEVKENLITIIFVIFIIQTFC